jgi:uncharacterized protein DUF5615
LKFKADENLPTEYAAILREAGHEADTVANQKLSGAEKRCWLNDVRRKIEFS